MEKVAANVPNFGDVANAGGVVRDAIVAVVVMTQIPERYSERGRQ
jgi:hypothetical protein